MKITMRREDGTEATLEIDPSKVYRLERLATELLVTDGWHKFYCKTMDEAAYLVWLLNQPAVHSLIIETSK